jgi:hypothetical protein
MADGHGDQDWLDPQTLARPQCGALLFRVVHSPFYDHWQLYCDSCANSVEVSYYDKTVMALIANISSHASLILRRTLRCGDAGY